MSFTIFGVVGKKAQPMKTINKNFGKKYYFKRFGNLVLDALWPRQNSNATKPRGNRMKDQMSETQKMCLISFAG